MLETSYKLLAICYVIITIIYIVRSINDYRKYKQGEIYSKNYSKISFWTNILLCISAFAISIIYYGEYLR